MTSQRTFKRRVRARMEKTGESYTAARRMLIAGGEPPGGGAAWTPPASDEALTGATGRGWDAWLAALDAWGALGRSHTEIARWLMDERAVPGWWAQCITVGFERARGLRAPGQRADGWSVTATRTIGVPVERLFRAFDDPGERTRWLPGAPMRRRTATAPRTARYDWEDGSTRVVAGFERVADGKSRIAMAHERLPDAGSADDLRAYWRARLTDLKALLEQEA